MGNGSGSDKHVILSGGSRGLGKAIIEALVSEGYKVSTFSRHAADPVEGVFHQKADLASSEDMKGFIDAAIKENGPIYALINNAAVVQEGVLATLPEVEISKMIGVNLEGTIVLTRLVLRKMLGSESGRIVNISSIIGSRGYNGLSVYSATKAGLDGFTRSLSRELGKAKITVNSVAPGYMKTEMSETLSGSHLQQIIGRTPMGRLGELSDVTPAISFLLSEGAGFITGQTILVDGGISA